jgi:hypothetical protein
MVVSPIVSGMLGLEVDAVTHHVTFTPHVPADWNFFRVRNLRVGDVVLDLTYRKNQDGITLEVQHTGSGDCTIDFAPAFSPLAKVLRATLDGSTIASHLENHGVDQHALVQFPATRSVTVQIRTRNDFGYSINSQLPELGSASQVLRVISESWSRNSLALELQGISGKQYTLNLYNPNQVSSVDGGTLSNGKLLVSFPTTTTNAYTSLKTTLHFATTN